MAQQVEDKDKQSHSGEYGYDVFTASRIAGIKSHELARELNCSECVMIPVGVYAKKLEWKLKDITRSDRRLKDMLEFLNITHAKTLQRYSWPLIEAGQIPLICISPQTSGKTYTHLLYTISKCIAAVPIAKTDAIIAELDINDTFSPEKLSEKKKAQRGTSQLENELASLEIDQENFDFNSLGKEVDESSEQSEPEIEPDEFICHPKYIIICPSQQKVDIIREEINKMKSGAYGTRVPSAKRDDLAPRIRVAAADNTDDKLAIKCNESDIILGTPGPIIKCFELKYLTFAKCKKVFFDDFDLNIQLYNNKVRELAKYYLAQVEPSQDPEEPDDYCQVVIFSGKWTDLVKQYVSTMFPQRVLLFRSLVEASQYNGMKFEVEILSGPGIDGLSKMLESTSVTQLADQKIAIVCSKAEEAKNLSEKLINRDFSVKLVPQNEALSSLKLTRPINGLEPIYVIDDETIEFATDFLNDIRHLVHYSLPDEWSTFDERFRLFYRNIIESEKNLVTTIYLRGRSSNIDQIKRLYDILARSSCTLPSTVLQLRDYMNHQTRHFCWRWATTGVCRLEKLSRNDRFGSFCPHRHTIVQNDPEKLDQLLKFGQFKITITHCVSPNEFYFRFKARRDFDSHGGKWDPIESTGLGDMEKLQTKLNAYRSTPSMSVPLELIMKGKVFGVYFSEEARVDRVMILENLNRQDNKVTSYDQKGANTLAKFRYSLEYGKQISVEKIDYGIVVSVFVSNIIQLSNDLISIPRLCFRGFYVGVKPALDEPDWPYKATRGFEDCVKAAYVKDIKVWLRLTNGDAFWFDNMTVTNQLRYLSNQTVTSYPYKKLVDEGLAASNESNLIFLQPSMRTITLQKWHTDQLESKANYAFLPRDQLTTNIQVLYIEKDLTLYVRIQKYYKLLQKLQADLRKEFDEGKLKQQKYLAPGVFCLVKMVESDGYYELNRCKIQTVCEMICPDGQPDTKQTKFGVSCLDHGDFLDVTMSDLYQISEAYLTRLPFQAIKYRLAAINPVLFEEKHESERKRIQDMLYCLTRDEENDFRRIKSHAADPEYLYLWVLDEDEKLYRSLMDILDKKFDFPIFTNKEPSLRESYKYDAAGEQQDEKTEDEEGASNNDESPKSLEDMIEQPFKACIVELLLEIAEKEIAKMKADIH